MVTLERLQAQMLPALAWVPVACGALPRKGGERAQLHRKEIGVPVI